MTFLSGQPYKALEDPTAIWCSGNGCALGQACGTLVGLRSLLALISTAAHEVLCGCLVMEMRKGTGLFLCRALPPLPGCGAGGAVLFMQALAAAHQSG